MSRVLTVLAAVLTLLAAGGPAALAAAPASFSTSFEAGQPQPGPSSAQGMRTAVGGGPSSAWTAKTHVGFTGVKALEYAGQQSASGHDKLFDVDIPVTRDTTLSYKIFPALMSQDLGAGLPSPSTYAAVDLVFADGTHLSDLDAQDQHGYALNARAQGASKALFANQWNAVSSRIGEVAAGRTITQILVDYDNPSGAADFDGWLDDISVADRPQEQQADLADWVVTTRGTDSNGDFSRGNNFPATAVPHGFNFWTPVTDAGSLGSLYSYQQGNDADNSPRLQAFAVSHEPSIWIGDRDTFQVMPSNAAGTPDPDRGARALPFSHDNEVARPYHYGVTFDNGMRTDIAPTDHAAMFRFTFTGDDASLIFDNVNNNGGITLDPQGRSISGYSDTQTLGALFGGSRMFFYATFDKPVTASGMLPASGRSNVTGYYRFDTAGGRVVTMRIATSLISVDQAKHNLALEIAPDDTFESVEAQARDAWDKSLGVISDVRGASPDELTTLYSSLYRLNLYPNSAAENTGTAADPVLRHVSPTANPTGPSTATHTGAEIDDGPMYVNNGFWDTYRSEWPADSLLYPSLTGRMIDGFLNQYKEGGWVSQWSSPGYGNAMLGTNADVAFADAYLKGVTNFDVQAAYDAAIKDASVVPDPMRLGRNGLDTSNFLGYTPTSTGFGLSWSIEDYVNDFGIANMSKALYERSAGDDPQRESYRENATYFRNRAQDYVNLFDPEVGFFQGRSADGSWRLDPAHYDPRVWGNDYAETDGWGMAFSVPQDGQGLANLYGGRKQLADKLDEFFATPETARYPGSYGGTIHEMREAAYGQMGEWAVNNQPGYHTPYMYDYAGEPYKAQALIRTALPRLFGGSEIGQGYPGDEDNGALSAWYVFSALGFYPLQAGSPNYVIGSPLFRSATINLENGHKIVVNAPDNSADNVYVQGLKVNGTPYGKTSLTQDMLSHGAVLDFDMGPQPSKWGTNPDALPPSITKGDEVPRPLRDMTGPYEGTASADDGTDVSALFDDTSDSQATFATATPTVTWQFSDARQETASHYTLTSAAKAGDPASWVLEGSEDGQHWSALDQRANEQFRWRRYTRAFAIAHPAPYRYYRLRVTGNSGAATTSLAEVELLGHPPDPQGRALATAVTPKVTLVAPSGSATTQTVTLDVEATAPGAAQVDITTHAPDGWTVTPARTAATVQSDGKPGEVKIPLTVTVPGGVPEGDYAVAATASITGPGEVRSTATGTIRVTRSIEFDPGTDAEQPWLADADGSQLNSDHSRFADGDHYFVYRFPLPANTTGGTASLLIENQFLVQASSDGEHWTTVMQEDNPVIFGSNRGTRSFDIAPYLGADKTLYIRVADSQPADGWGGLVRHVAVGIEGG